MDWEGCYVDYNLVVVQGIFGGLNAILCIASGIAFSGTSAESKHAGLKLGAWIATLAGTICSFLFVEGFTRQARCDTDWYDDNAGSDDDYKFGGIIVYALVLCTVLHIFSIRLRKTFENTKYELSKCLQYITKFFIPIGGVLLLIDIIVTWTIGTSDGCFENNTCVTLQILASVIGLSIIIYGICLLVIFVHKLRVVITDYNSYVGGKAGGAGAGSGSESDDKNIVATDELISVMSRYTILVCVAISFTFVVAFTPLLMAFYQVDFAYLLTFMSIDAFLNCLCLILQFKASDKIYYLLCCCLHKQCIKRQASKINKQIESNKGKESMLENDGNANDKNIENTMVNVEMQSTNALRI